MTAANGGTGLAVAGSLAVSLVFMISYVLYGNRLRAPAGRALMVMSASYVGLLILLLLRHPFGISTDRSRWFTWAQIIMILFSGTGTGFLLALMVRANGRWPWQHNK